MIKLSIQFQIVILIAHCNLKSGASAIMTTDKYPKYLTKSYMLGRKKIRFRGLCKGAGMIQPNMATMLSFIETDASLSKSFINKALKYCSKLSFNSISVDGDMSTNDTVVFLYWQRSSRYKNKNLESNFLACASDFFIQLSSKIVKDGEGATKFIKLTVNNSQSLALAQKIARKISFLLVKTAMYGGDPNWGRIVSSIGSVDSKDIIPHKITLKLIIFYVLRTAML